MMREVVMLPVTFLVDGQDVVFITGAGSKLSQVEVGHYVGFEADSYDPATHAGWWVVVSGFAEIVRDADEVARLGRLQLAPWGSGAEPVWVRIRPTAVSGRRTPRSLPGGGN